MYGGAVAIIWQIARIDAAVGLKSKYRFDSMLLCAYLL